MHVTLHPAHRLPLLSHGGGGALAKATAGDPREGKSSATEVWPASQGCCNGD